MDSFRSSRAQGQELTERKRRTKTSSQEERKKTYLTLTGLLEGLRERRTIAHIRRACPTISTRAFLASAGLLTSRKNAMRAPRMPSSVFKRT
jgi:hypothetical protein